MYIFISELDLNRIGERERHGCEKVDFICFSGPTDVIDVNYFWAELGALLFLLPGGSNNVFLGRNELRIRFGRELDNVRRRSRGWRLTNARDETMPTLRGHDMASTR